MPCHAGSNFFCSKTCSKSSRAVKCQPGCCFFCHETSARWCGSSSYFYHFLSTSRVFRQHIFWNHWPATTIEGWRVSKEYILLSTGLGDSANPGKWTLVLHGMPRGIHKWHAKKSMKTLWKTTHKFQKKCSCQLDMLKFGSQPPSAGESFQFAYCRPWNPLANHGQVCSNQSQHVESPEKNGSPRSLRLVPSLGDRKSHGRARQQLDLRVACWFQCYGFPTVQHFPPRSQPRSCARPTVQPHRVTSIAARFDEATPVASMNRLAALGRETRWSCEGTSVYLSDIGWHGQSWAYLKWRPWNDGFGWIWGNLVLGMPLFEPDLKHSETLATRKFSAPPIVFLLED